MKQTDQQSDEYKRGWTDAEQKIVDKFNKLLLKKQTESYDKGYKAGANQKDNKPCVCGFWGSDKPC